MELDKLIERLWKILDGIQTQIRGYDAKAQIVVGIDGIVAGFLGAQAVNLAKATASFWPATSSCLLMATAISSLVALAYSLHFAIRTIYPVREFGQPTSLLFFGHIGKKFHTDFGAGRLAYASLTDESLRDDVSNQIVAVAHICNNKAARFNKAVAAMAIGLAFWTTTLALQFWVEHRIVWKQISQHPEATFTCSIK